MEAVNPELEHPTVSAVVVSDAGVLLHKHKKLDMWLGPGGHIEAGEWPEDAVLREVLEETGLIGRHPPEGPEVVDHDTHELPNGHIHHDTRYLIFADAVEPTPGPGESLEVHWFTPAEALERTDGSFARAIKAALLIG